MRALCVLIGLYVCLSSGEPWNRYPHKYLYVDSDNVNIHQGQDRDSYMIKRFDGGSFSPYFLPSHLKPNLHSKLNYAQVTAEPSQAVKNVNDHQVIDAKSHHHKETTNLFSNPVEKTYTGNEILRNNGVQNNLSFSARRSFEADEPNQDIKKLTTFSYVLNKGTNDPYSPASLTSTLSTNTPNEASILESNHGGQFWVNENNQNTKNGFWIHPRPVPNPYPIIPDNNINPFPIFPDNNVNPHPFSPDTDVYPYPIVPDGNDGYPYPIFPDIDNTKPYQITPDNGPDQNVVECHNLIDIINALRILVGKHDISEESYSLKMLFRILKVFILKNNIQHLPFNLIVRDIGKALFIKNSDHNNLREEDEIVSVLQEFKDNELNHFLYQIKSHRETNLQVAVSKLASLLYKLKQTLIQKRFSQEIIRLVIKRVVQYSVPLVGYYFEKECKIKTQKYILQNLQVALKVNLESVKHIGSVEDLETEENFADLDFGIQDGVGLGKFKSQVNVGNAVSLGNSENQDNLRGLSLGQGFLGGLGLENLAGLGSAAGSLFGVFPINKEE